MHDPGLRRKATRTGRQKGCYVYLPQEVLDAARPELNGQLPHYRTWAGKGGSVLIRLYREP